VLLPKFRLETAVLRPESPLLIFSRSKRLIYQKGGYGGWLGWATPTWPCQGELARPGGCCSPPGSPLALICSNIFYLFQNNSPWNFSPFGVVQNRYPDGAFSGPDFQLPDFPLLVHTL
jgi:hypothetical protein